MEAKTTVLHASHTSLLSHPDRVAAVTEETAAAVSQQAALGIYLAFFLVGLALGWAFPLPSFESRLGQFVVGVIAFASLVIAGTRFHEVRVPRWLALSSASVTSSRPCHVSSLRRVERSMRISRTALTCLLRLKAYGTYPAGAAFGAGRTANSP